MVRVRPHFKAHTSISHHPLMAKIYPDNDLLSLWLRLGCLAIDRYAAKTGNVLRIHRNELSALTGGKRRDKAEVTLRLLAGYLKVTCRLDGDYWSINLRNLSKKQGFGSNNQPRMQTPDTETEAEREGTARRGVDLADDQAELSPDFVEKLKEIRPGGVLYSDQEIQNWFQRVRPIMRQRGVRNHQRAAGNWWRSVTRTEIDSATRWVQLQRAEKLKPDVTDKDAVPNDSLQAFEEMFKS